MRKTQLVFGEIKEPLNGHYGPICTLAMNRTSNIKNTVTIQKQLNIEEI